MTSFSFTNGNNFVSSRVIWCVNFYWPILLSKNCFNISNNKKSCPEKNTEEEKTYEVLTGRKTYANNTSKRFVVELCYFEHTS